MHLIGHRKTRTEQLIDQGHELFDDLAERAAPRVEAARSKLVTEVLPAAQAAAATARETARETAVPKAREALESARESARENFEAAREISRQRAEEHLPQRKESHKVRKTFVVLALAGLAAAVAKALGGRSRSLPYVPPSPAEAPAATMQPPPSPRHAGDTDGEFDRAGADPGEALSDAAAGPHPVTTPDAPAEAERFRAAEELDEIPIHDREP